MKNYYVSNGFNWTIIHTSSEEEADLEAELYIGMYVNELREATEEEVAEYLSEYPDEQPHFLESDDEPTCRACGCTDDFGCIEGCWWVEPDLCSRCAGETAVTEET